MKKTIVALILSFPAVAHAQYRGWHGKLDLGGGPRPMIARELNDGMWLIGGKQWIWELDDDGVPVFTFGLFTLTRLELQNPAYGATAGVPVGGLGHEVLKEISALSSTDVSAPPFFRKLGDVSSFEGFAGYRPNGSYDQHHIVYGISCEVRIPFTALQDYAKGTNGEKGL